MTDHDQATVYLPPRPTGAPPVVSGEEVALAIDKITTTKDGQVMIVLKGEALDQDSTRKIERLLHLQRGGLLRVRFAPVQPDEV